MRTPWRAAAAAACIVLASAAFAAPVSVVHREGSAHGFLVLRNAAGAAIADGELLQSERNGRVETKLAFRFHDGSYSEETVVFTQERVFRALRYEQVQRGPSFRTDLRASLDLVTGRYTVRARDRGDDEETKHEGTIELPDDTANGLLPILLKNMPRGGALHIVAFTPKPRVVEIHVSAAGSSPAVLGDSPLRVARYVVKPELGVVTKTIAKILGKLPADTHLWIVVDGVPAFFAFEGQLAPGLPSWRIESALPRLARGPG
jgi:hypothetical protein